MSSKAPGRSFRILLIANDDHLRDRLRSLLGSVSSAHTIDRAAHRDAGARIAADRHDVVLADLAALTRDGDGSLAAGVFRDLRVPVIALIEDEDAGGDVDAMYAGAADCLGLGSTTAAHLQRAIRYAVERHRETARLRERAAALGEYETLYHSTFNDAPVGIAHVSLDGRWLHVNPRLCERLGYTVTELRRQTIADLIHGDDLPQYQQARDRLLAGEISRDATQWRYRHADGTYVWLAVSASLHRSAAGDARHFILILKDISEQRRAEEELDHIFNLSPDMISTATYSGFFLRTNAAWTATLGYSAEDLRAQPLINFVHPDDRDATMRAREHVLSGGRLFGFTNRYRTRAGDYRWIEWHTKADTQGRVIYAVARDRTESRQLEERVRQSQKMEAVGRLAGGIAHDFNNLLTVIIGFSDMTLDGLPAGDERRDSLEQVRLAAQSAAALTRQLLAFSRKQVLDPQIFDLRGLVLEIERMLGRIIGEDIELAAEVPDAPCGVNADRTQIEHAILNLAVNARDAMPSGGRLRIATEIVRFDEDLVAAHPGARSGPHVVLTVADTGIGMTADVLAHAFEPFFTTKEEGKGTGLGLATVYGTVRQSGGHIGIASTLGKGTAVTIALPHVALEEPARGDAPSRGGAALPASGVILVVEDQAEVRKVVRRTLLAGGYTVLEVENGPGALDLLRDDETAIDLLLTDVVMPQMSGPDLAAEVMRRFPGTRVLYMSGYTAQMIGEHGILEDGVELIQKPFTPRQLTDRVRQVLET
jgi:PAS domain S-box-containing protein